MTKRRLWIGCFLALGSSVALAQSPGSAPVPEDTAGRGEIVRLAASVDRMAASLDGLVKLERLSLMMQWLGIEERRLAPLREEILRQQQEVRTAREDLERVQVVIAQLDEQLVQATRDGRTDEVIDLRLEKQRLESARRQRQESIAAGEAHAQELEIEYDRARRRFDDLSVRLDEALDSLGW